MAIIFKHFGSYESDAGFEPIRLGIESVLDGEADVVFAQSKSITEIFAEARGLISELLEPDMPEGPERQHLIQQGLAGGTYYFRFQNGRRKRYSREYQLKSADSEDLSKVTDKARVMIKSILSSFESATKDFYILKEELSKISNTFMEFMHCHSSQPGSKSIMAADVVLACSQDPQLTTIFSDEKAETFCPINTISIMRNGGIRENPFHGTPRREGRGSRNRIFTNFTVTRMNL